MTLGSGLTASSLTAMPMREECKHFESRTYAGGDTVRRCKLDLAPDAPWRCPTDCSGYERRLVDVAWQRGSLVSPATPPEPPGLDDGSAAAVLDEAEDILNAVGADVLRELEMERRRVSGWRRLLPRRKRP
jgi:hypothetical protein